MVLSVELAVYQADILPLRARMAGNAALYTQERTAESGDQVWILQHFPVFTQGGRGRPEHLLMPEIFPSCRSTVADKSLYHGPGQLVVYPLLDIGRLKLGARSLVSLMKTVWSLFWQNMQ